MIALTIEVPETLRARLTAAARRVRKSPAQFVREAVEEKLKLAPSPRRQSLYDSSRDLCGSLNGGPRDLARNKKHLKDYGAWKR